MSRFWNSAALAVAVIGVVASVPGFAATVENLYQAKTIVTGTGEASRMPGLAQCLEDVLVKVSGDPRLIGDSAVSVLASNVADYVASFRYRDRLEGMPVHDDQGTYDRPHDLTVDFAPEKIDAALRSLGREPWSAERPRLAVFLAVRTAKGTFVLAGDGDQSPYMAESLAAASARIAMPVALPAKAVLKGAGLTFDKLASADPAGLEAAAHAAGGDLPLVGTLTWSDVENNWIADWRLRHDGTEAHWQMRGVNFDEAFRNAMRGAAQVLSGHGVPQSNAP